MQETFDELYKKYLKEKLDLIFKDPRGTKQQLFPFSKIEKIEEKKDDGFYTIVEGSKIKEEWKDKEFKFHDGFAIIRFSSSNYNFIDYNGNLLSDDKFGNAYDFDHGFARVYPYQNSYVNYVNKEGKLLNSDGYEDAYFSGYAFALKEYGRWRIVDTNNKPINDETYKSCEYNDGFFLLEKDKKFLILDKEGKEITKERYDKITFTKGTNSLAVVSCDKGYNFIDKNGGLICDEWYDYVSSFDDEYTTVRRHDGKENYIDKEGNLLCARWYDEVDPFSNGFGNVRFDGDWNVVNSSGKEISKEWFTSIYKFKNGYCRVFRYYGADNYIDIYGNPIRKEWFIGGYKDSIITASYGKDRPLEVENYFLDDFYNGVARVSIHTRYDGIFVNYINTQGEFISDKWFDEGNTFDDKDVVSVELYDHNKRKISYNLLDTNGNLLLDKWQPSRYELQNKSFVVLSDNRAICKKKDLNGYSVKTKKMGGYQCIKGNEVFNIKYEPLKIYDEKYVLCLDGTTVTLFDRDTGKYERFKDANHVEFSDNLITNGYEVFLIYGGRKIDITKYYRTEIMKNDSYYFNKGIELLSKDEFFIGNEDQIRERYRKAELEAENARNEIARDQEQKNIQRQRSKIDIENAKKEIELSEAMRYAALAVKKFHEHEQNGGKIEKIKASYLYSKRNDINGEYLVFQDFYLQTGMYKYVDLSDETFKNVKISGMDFRGCNIMFNPQDVYKQDISNCNFEGIFFPVKTSFIGVNIEGTKFTRSTFGINEMNLKEGIYDENTTLDGIPLVELINENEYEEKRMRA